MGCAGGFDDSVVGVVVGLLARGRFADAVAPVSSRRAGRVASRIRPRFRLGGLPRAHLILPSPWGMAYILGVLPR